MSMPWSMPASGQWQPNSMPDMNQMNMGSYSQDQWTAMQQQNWLQWSQWQQQYAQWQSQYGDKFAEQMQAMGGMPPLPPNAGVAPPAPPGPPPPDQPPPPPPHENNQPLYAQKAAPPPPVGPPKQAIQPNAYNNPNANTGNTPQQASQTTVNAEALRKLAEEERLFDIQFQKWEDEIQKWKQDNQNHPDRQAYKEYEEKFEGCRAELLERRQQMKLKRARLVGSQTSAGTKQQAVETKNPYSSQPPNMQSNQKPDYSSQQYQSFNKNQQAAPFDKNKPQPKDSWSNNKKEDPQDRYESYEDMDTTSQDSTSQNDNVAHSTFLSTSASSKGIPGLDLVPEPTTQPDVIEIPDDHAQSTNNQDQYKNAPVLDYTNISKGINSILGDEKIMNILSMVKNTPPGHTEPAAAQTFNNTFQNSQWNRNQNATNSQQLGNRQGPSHFNQASNVSQPPNRMYDNRNNISQQAQGGEYRDNFHEGPKKDQYDGSYRNNQFGGPQNMPARNNQQAGGSQNNQYHGSPNMPPRNDQFGVGPPNRTNQFGGPPNMPPRNDQYGGPQTMPPRNDQYGGPLNMPPRNDQYGGPQNMPPRNDQYGGPQNMPTRNDQYGGHQNMPPRNDHYGGPQNMPPRNDQYGGSQNMPNRNEQSGGPNNIPASDQFGGTQNMPPRNDQYQSGPQNMAQRNNQFGSGTPNMPPRNNQYGGNMNQMDSNYYNMNNRGPGPNRPNIASLLDTSIQPPINANPQEYSNNINSRNIPEPVKPQWVEEPLFTPSIIVEYEHMPLRLKARDFIEPAHTFDYNHISKDEGKKVDFDKEMDDLFYSSKNRKPEINKEREYPKEGFQREAHLYSKDPHEREPYPRDLKEQYARDTYSRDGRDLFTRHSRDPYARESKELFPRDSRDSFPRDSRDSFPRDSRDSFPRDSRDSFPRDSRDSFPRDSRDSFPRDSRDPFPRESREPYPRDARDLNSRDGRIPPRDSRDSGRDPMPRDFNRDSFDRDRDRRPIRDNRDDINSRGYRDDDRRRTDSRLAQRDEIRDRDRDKDRNRDRRDDSTSNSSRSKDNIRGGDVAEDAEKPQSKDSTVGDAFKKKPEVLKHVVMIDDLLELPGREMRPEKIVIILRGPPGSGKSYLAKLIRDKEAEHGGTVRIMSIDDYFMSESEVEENDPATGKLVKKTVLKYEYDEKLEETYINSLKRAFRRSLTDGYFSFIVYDAPNDRLKCFSDIWNIARQNGFQVYVCTMDLDAQACFKRNIHNRTLDDIEVVCARFVPTLSHHIQLDATTLLQNAAIQDVQMEDAIDEVVMEDTPNEHCVTRKVMSIQVETSFTSKWERMDDENKLARLDGTSRPLRPSQFSMEDYLQLDDWKPSVAKPGKKTVRWADIEERRQQEKMRAIGFVVGQTDWNRMTDPTMGSSALTKTKYIERVRRN